MHNAPHETPSFFHALRGHRTLVNPQPGAVYRLVDGLAAAQAIPLKADSRGDGPLYWFVDDRLFAATHAAMPVNSIGWR
ncbi:MAG: hypothetical protein HGB05_13150 [Chloroflexi bacterium]|nr:hypothetical protein [Chloroflexota bacterium]